ncbi:hypothetical protein P3T36_004321 [Kitasatospora sp. MAP12-15]|uniref:hypothetical protein n=1 Tax=unclassified Kitasatospora TaxID=2633591 RepID=UPI00247536DF|nr:hypothetical protein [Kitasatospora sp. MAP12-44]MDH6108214.1 hypothetical protein [Kitasatospora sp. MAP12-44]
MNSTGDIRVSTVVMAHPARREQAEQLVRRHPELDAEIVFDPDPQGKPATLRTAKAAWSRIREGATHQLVLQEDVQLCHDFKTVLHQALSVAPQGAIALFANWVMSSAQAVRLAALCGASWTPNIESWTPTQALLLPAEVARQFADYTERYSEDKPDNRAMAEFLADRGITAYIAIPNLVQHRPTPSLLLNDLLYGIRNSVVFPASADVGTAPFNDRVVAPPAVAHMGLGDFETMCHYDPVIGDPRLPTTGHEVLITYGMSTTELSESFLGDLDYHPEAVATGWSETLLFQFWITMFIQGVIARGLPDLAKLEDLDAAFENNRWARAALDTVPAAALRKMYTHAELRRHSDPLTPLCVSAMRAGFAAVDHWPGLSALWQPDIHQIVPQWNLGDKQSTGQVRA